MAVWDSPPPNPQQAEREAAQELVKKYGAPGSTEGVLGVTHESNANGVHQDLWSISKDARGKLGQPELRHIKP